MSIKDILYLSDVKQKTDGNFELRYKKFNGSRKQINEHLMNKNKFVSLLDRADEGSSFMVYASGKALTPFRVGKAVESFIDQSADIASTIKEEKDLKDFIEQVNEVPKKKGFEKYTLSMEEFEQVKEAEPAEEPAEETEETKKQEPEREEKEDEQSPEARGGAGGPEIEEDTDDVDTEEGPAREAIRGKRKLMGPAGQEAKRREIEQLRAQMEATEGPAREAIRRAQMEATRGQTRETFTGKRTRAQMEATEGPSMTGTRTLRGPRAGPLPGTRRGPPPPPSTEPGSEPGTASLQTTIISEEDAKKKLSQETQPDIDPSTEVKLIGPDSAKEMKEVNVIYKEAFRMVFSDRSGVRELKRFEESAQAKEEESKSPENIFNESEDVRKVYEDQFKIPKLVYSTVDDKKDLLRQWNEIQVLAKGTNENLKGKPNQDVLGQFNSVGVVIDVSNLGMNLQDFMNYINARNLTNKTDKQKGNNKLSGFMKGVNVEDVAPEEPPKPDTIEPIPTKKMEEDPAQTKGVYGKPEFISNERIKGMVNINGFKKPVKKEKSKRVVIML